MSAGEFTITRYQATYNGGVNIHPIKVQDTTLELDRQGATNDPPTGDTTNPISASASNTRRELGLRARYVVIRNSRDTPPDGYLPGGTIRVPILTQAFFDTFTRGDEVTYLGQTATVVSVEQERVV